MKGGLTMEAGENEKEIDFGFGLKQAKNGLVLAEGEKIVDCFDYDCYMTYDRRNKKMKTETTVLLTNKRMVHMVCSANSTRTSKRNVEIPVERIESVSSYFKNVKHYSLGWIITLAVFAVLFLTAGILSIAKIIPALTPVDLLIEFLLAAAAVAGAVLLIVFAKYRVCFGITVYTKDRPDVPCRVMCVNKAEGFLSDLLRKNDDCFTADLIETEHMAHVLANEILQIKMNNEAEELKNGNDIG